MQKPNNNPPAMISPSMLKQKQIQQIARKQTKALTEAMSKKNQELFGRCFIQNQNNHERFGECLSTAQQKIKNVQKSLKYDGIFMETKYQMCVTDQKDKAQCVEEFRKLLVGSQQKRLSDVQKI